MSAVCAGDLDLLDGVHEISVDDMIAGADEAMYEAKQAGGDRTVP